MEADNDNPLDGLTEHSEGWWAAVYKAHAPAAYKAVQRLFQSKKVSYDASDFEDVVHDVFARFHEKRSIDNTTTNMGGLIRKSAVNEAIDHIRRQRKTADPTNDDVAAEDEYLAIDDERIAAIDKDDERSRQAAHVVKKLDSLSEKERRVARGIAIGETHAEIALREHVSRERITQIVKDIRRKLQADYGLRSDGMRMATDE